MDTGKKAAQSGMPHVKQKLQHLNEWIPKMETLPARADTYVPNNNIAGRNM